MTLFVLGLLLGASVMGLIAAFREAAREDADTYLRRTEHTCVTLCTPPHHYDTAGRRIG